MSLSIVESDAFETIKKVSDLYVKGVTSPFTIARRTGMKVVEVRAALDTWHEIIQKDAESKDLARDALHLMLERYDRLLEEANSNLDDLKTLSYDASISAQINTTIKTIAELDKVRVDLLQKAGLLDNNDLGDELAERERREEMILDILKHDLCDACKHMTKSKIAEIVGYAEGEVVSE